MFSRPFFVLLLSAIAVSAKPSLSLEVAGAERVDGVSNFKVKTTVKNTGDETLQLLTDPRGPLTKTPSDAFVIKNVNGSSPQFTGVHIKYVHQSVAAARRPNSFTTLEPGQSFSVDHDLSAAYNFTLPGEGLYTVEAKNKFHYLNTTSNTSVPIFADSIALKAILTGQLAAGRVHALASPQKRDQYKSCSADQQQLIAQATVQAKAYSEAALQYLTSTSTSTERYKTWFGKFTAKRHQKVINQFTKLANNDFSAMTFDCSCDEADTFAFVYPDEFGKVHLCPAFWDAPMNGTDSMGGTLVHETSHFDKIASTEDTEYGQSDCKKLAKKSPKEAINNADSHEYFAENHPTLR